MHKGWRNGENGQIWGGGKFIKYVFKSIVESKAGGAVAFLYDICMIFVFVWWWKTYRRSYLCGRRVPSKSSYSSVFSLVVVLGVSFGNNHDDDEDGIDDDPKSGPWIMMIQKRGCQLKKKGWVFAVSHSQGISFPKWGVIWIVIMIQNRHACLSHHRIVIWFCFWFVKLNLKRVLAVSYSPGIS